MPQDKRSPYGTVRVGSQRIINGSLPGSRSTEATMVLMKTRKARKPRGLRDPSEGNNNRSNLEAVQETRLGPDKSPNLNAKPAAPCLSCADRKNKSDTTFRCITRKILTPARGIFFNKKGLESEGRVTLGSHTISNSSLLDLDLSEFTSSELADIMGQMKMDKDRGSPLTTSTTQGVNY